MTYSTAPQASLVLEVARLLDRVGNIPLSSFEADRILRRAAEARDREDCGKAAVQITAGSLLALLREYALASCEQSETPELPFSTPVALSSATLVNEIMYASDERVMGEHLGIVAVNTALREARSALLRGHITVVVLSANTLLFLLRAHAQRRLLQEPNLI